jgi:hypothetical protein
MQVDSPDVGKVRLQPELPDGERSLRDVLDLLLQDIVLTPVDATSLPWDKPVFVVRTAPLDWMPGLFDEIQRHHAASRLHVMSHARDADAIRAMAPGATFHPYTAEGRYRLEDVPLAMLHRFRQMDFGTLIFPDPGTSADLCDEIERLFTAIDLQRMVTYTRDGGFARARDWQRRARAHAAFLKLIEWYQSSVEAESSIAANQVVAIPAGATNDRS